MGRLLDGEEDELMLSQTSGSHSNCIQIMYRLVRACYMAVASGPAGLVLAGPVLTGSFTPVPGVHQSGEQSTARQSHTR